MYRLGPFSWTRWISLDQIGEARFELIDDLYLDIVSFQKLSRITPISLSAFLHDKLKLSKNCQIVSSREMAIITTVFIVTSVPPIA